MQTLLIGVQDFVQLRQDNLLYVDKTAKLLELIENGRRYFLSRPRRFGKSHGDTFTPPPEDYNAEDFKSSAWYVKPGELKYTMRLTIYEPMASIVSETPRHLTQVITRTSPDTVELTAVISDLETAFKLSV